jgi:TRAP-type C4-dicarboxylate transport system permease small subunit
MSERFGSKQKSLKRRFLLILGLITFVFFFAFGVFVMFWGGFTQLENYQRKIFGALIILYSILRFSRILKKDKSDE